MLFCQWSPVSVSDPCENFFQRQTNNEWHVKTTQQIAKERSHKFTHFPWSKYLCLCTNMHSWVKCRPFIWHPCNKERESIDSGQWASGTVLNTHSQILYFPTGQPNLNKQELEPDQCLVANKHWGFHTWNNLPDKIWKRWRMTLMLVICNYSLIL